LQSKIDEGTGYPYLLFLPAGYPGDAPWPMILFLHGVGERGTDLERLKAHGIPRAVEERPELPFVCVSPQCPTGASWSVQLLGELLAHALARYRVDPDRVYLTGLSMGGYGAWVLAADQPHRFAAVAPVCGGGDPRRAGRLRRVPVWTFHGAKDAVVPLSETLRMVEALERCGGDARLTVYPEAGHDSWTETYRNAELYEWFLSRRRPQEGHGSV
jgi:predicted peptidase